LQANAPEEEEEEEQQQQDDVDDGSPPLHVFFDIEAMQPHEQHIANLVVAKPKTTIVPCVSQANIVAAIFSNGCIP